MEFWISFWTIVFVATLVIFSGLVLVIALGGWADIKSMLVALDRQETDSTEPQVNSDTKK